MPAIALRELYAQGLKNFMIAPVADTVLKRVIAGDDTADDFESAIQVDAFFTQILVSQASRHLKHGSVKSLAHAVVLLGKDNVRGFILGHSIQRVFDPHADANLTKFSDNRTLLTHALEAETLARAIGCEYPGSAFAAGYVYDIFEAWLASDAKLNEHFRAYIDSTWMHVKKTAALTWAFADHPKINSNLKKLAFTAGLLHDVGRLLLCCSYANAYAPLLGTLENLRAQTPADDSFEVSVDQAEFHLSHAEVGSLLVFATGVLKEYDELVDYHHEVSGLKARTPAAFSLVLLLQLADRITNAQIKKPNLDAAELEMILKSWAQPPPIPPTQILELLMTLSAKSI